MDSLFSEALTVSSEIFYDMGYQISIGYHP